MPVGSKAISKRCLATSSIIALIAGVCLGAPAHAQVQQVNIPPGQLKQALVALAKQTGNELLYDPELVAGRGTAGFAGEYSVEDALTRLLGDDRLVVTRVGPHAFTLKRKAATAPAGRNDPRPFGAEAARGVDEGPPRTIPPMAAPNAPVTVEEVRVTGTNIRGATAGAAPLVTLTRDTLDRSGYATVAGALSALPQNYGGQDTEGTVATGADTQGLNSTYATGINLRGLGPNATLVLVNGRRMGGSGFNGDFADVSNLPTIAVSRVEVLLDGASAIYGSDAVGGVVNVILRRDLDGGEVRLSAGTGSNDTPREYQVGAVVGRTWTGGGVLLAYEGYQRDPLAAADRPYTASADLRPFGGTDHRVATAFPGNVVAVNPATGVSGPFFGIPAGQPGVGLKPSDFLPGVINRMSRQAGQDVLPGQRRQNAYLAAHQALTDGLELSGDLRYGFRAARTAISAPVSTFTVGRNNPFFVSPNGANSNQIQYSFVGELPNPIIRATAETLTASLGARLTLPHAWAAEAYVGFAQEIDATHAQGLVNTAILAEALGNVPDRPETAYSPARDGFFNPYTGVPANSAAVLAAVSSGFTTTRSKSQITTFNLQADGPLFTLPGGDLKRAVGANVRREQFGRSGSSFSSTVTPRPQNATSGERTIAAGFAELRAPLVRAANARPGLAALELSAAVRVEHYSDFGSTTNPKLGVIWAPHPDVRLRATYGQSFRAPSLQELLSAEIISPIFLTRAGQDALTLTRQGGNPNLKPETAESWTAGFDVQPAGSDARLSLTWFDTDFNGRIDRPVNENLDGALEDPRFASFIQFVNPANAADLALVSRLLAQPNATATANLFPASSYVAIADLRSVNTGELRVRGIDIDASQELNLFNGRLLLTGAATRLLAYDQRLTPASPVSPRLGLVTYPAKLRARVSADWRHDNFGGGLALNYLTDFHTAAGARIDERTTVDLNLWARATRGWLAGTTARLSIRNLFDTAPPFYDNPFGYAYDPSNADVIGRFVRFELTRSW